MDKDLAFKTDEELKPLGYYRDEIGQVRKANSNELVCGISGRLHKQYLLPSVQFLPGGKFTVIFVDKQTMVETGAALRGKVAVAGGGLVRHVGDLLKRSFENVLLKLLAGL